MGGSCLSKRPTGCAAGVASAGGNCGENFAVTGTHPAGTGAEGICWGRLQANTGFEGADALLVWQHPNSSSARPPCRCVQPRVASTTDPAAHAHSRKYRDGNRRGTVIWRTIEVSAKIAGAGSQQTPASLTSYIGNSGDNALYECQESGELLQTSSRRSVISRAESMPIIPRHAVKSHGGPSALPFLQARAADRHPVDFSSSFFAARGVAGLVKNSGQFPIHDLAAHGR
jgi:hypothetical protein